MILKTKFVTPVMDRIIHEVKADTKVKQCLYIFQQSSSTNIVLDFENCSRFNDDIAERLVNSLQPKLERLTVLSNGSTITQQMIDNLPGMILSKLPNLNYFDFLNSDMSDDGAIKIAAIIKTHSSLNYLLLRKSKIGDKGAIQLLNAIKENKSIENLDLYRNEISYKGEQCIGQIAQEIGTYRQFNLNLW